MLIVNVCPKDLKTEKMSYQKRKCTLFLDIGGVVLTNSWGWVARDRYGRLWPPLKGRHGAILDGGKTA